MDGIHCPTPYLLANSNMDSSIKTLMYCSTSSWTASFNSLPIAQGEGNVAILPKPRRLVSGGMAGCHDAILGVVKDKSVADYSRITQRQSQRVITNCQ